MSLHVVYYSNMTRNTERFVNKLGLPASRIEDGVPVPSVAIIPTYGAAAVPAVVVRALNNATKEERANIVAIVGTGNFNFGQDFCAGAKKLATKLGVPLIHKVELAGTPEDVADTLAAIAELEAHLQENA